MNKTIIFIVFFLRHVCRPFRNADFGNFDNKLAVLSLRCQSLLYLKLYKMRRHELLECQKIIGDHIQKANSSQHSSNNSASSPQQNGVSPTPSPAGSEGSVCSKSSGYTSAGEGGRSSNGGVNTPPLTLGSSSSSTTAAAAGGGGGSLLSVPHAVMQKQHQYCSYLSQCHELWEMADVYASRGRCEGGCH